MLKCVFRHSSFSSVLYVISLTDKNTTICTKERIVFGVNCSLEHIKVVQYIIPVCGVGLCCGRCVSARIAQKLQEQFCSNFHKTGT